jgi:hypothetical protein
MGCEESHWKAKWSGALWQKQIAKITGVPEAPDLER